MQGCHTAPVPNLSHLVLYCMAQIGLPAKLAFGYHVLGQFWPTEHAEFSQCEPTLLAYLMAISIGPVNANVYRPRIKGLVASAWWLSHFWPPSDSANICNNFSPVTATLIGPVVCQTEPASVGVSPDSWVRVHKARVRVRVHQARVRVHQVRVRVHWTRVRVRVHWTRVRVRVQWVRVRVWVLESGLNLDSWVQQ